MTARFQPNDRQRAIANAFSRNAQLLGRASTLARLDKAAASRFDHPRIGHVVAHVASKQAEFGRALVDEFRAGRFSAATALVRPLLEMATFVAWPLSTADDEEQRTRLLRLVIHGYREARNRGAELPPDADELLRKTTGKAARKPPDFRQMLKDLDAIERDEGGKEYWVSHGGYYDVAGLHVHATIWGPLGQGRRSPVEFIGVQALVNGHQYMAISAVSCALIASDNGLKEKIEARYQSVAAAQRSENERVTRR